MGGALPEMTGVASKKIAIAMTWSAEAITEASAAQCVSGVWIRERCDAWQSLQSGLTTSVPPCECRCTPTANAEYTISKANAKRRYRLIVKRDYRWDALAVSIPSPMPDAG